MPHPDLEAWNEDVRALVARLAHCDPPDAFDFEAFCRSFLGAYRRATTTGSTSPARHQREAAGDAAAGLDRLRTISALGQCIADARGTALGRPDECSSRIRALVLLGQLESFCEHRVDLDWQVDEDAAIAMIADVWNTAVLLPAR